MTLYSRPNLSDSYTLSQSVNCLKTLPFTAAHTYIEHIYIYLFIFIAAARNQDVINHLLARPWNMFWSDEHVSMFARAFMWEKINVRQPREGLVLLRFILPVHCTVFGGKWFGIFWTGIQGHPQNGNCVTNLILKKNNLLYICTSCSLKIKRSNKSYIVLLKET